MKTIRNLYIALVAAALVAAGGCVTQREVQRIITASNAAMIPQSLVAPGSTNSNDWNTPLGQINQLLLTLTNGANGVLSNQLTLRAAMLLTVNNQGAIADNYWNAIDSGSLLTARDRALYANNSTLVWWYNRAPSRAPLSGSEPTTLLNGVTNLSTSLLSLSGSSNDEIRVYLGTIRAQMMLKYWNNQSTIRSNQAAAVSIGIAKSLENYVGVFPAADVSWVQSNKTTQLPATLVVTSVRNRVWLRELIESYKETATNLGVTPNWSPSWITTY